MLFNIDPMTIIHKLPLVPIGVTAALFVITMIVSRMTKKRIKRRATHRAASSSGFWSTFWRSEQTFIIKVIGWLAWVLFAAATIYVWSGHLARAFVRLEYLYAPLARTLVIVIMAAIALKVSNQLIGYIIEQVTPITQQRTARGKQRADTLNHIFRYGATVVILLLAVLMLLDVFGIDLKAVLATIGIASLAVGFGAQSLVKDLVNGVFILVEDQYAVGDVVVINGEGGLVEKMTLRITQLRNTEGTLITISNGQVDMVKNMTSEWSRVDFIMDVAYETDLDRATTVIMDEATTLAQDWPDKIIAAPELKGVDAFKDSSIAIRVWITTKPLMQWDVKRELNRRIHKRFEREGIVIPFPQRTVWIKEPSEELFKRIAAKA